MHFQRFGEALNGVQDKLAEKRWYTGMGNNNFTNTMNYETCNNQNN